MTDWQDEYNKLQVNEQLQSRYRHLSPEAQAALAPALLAEQQSKPNNPYRRKDRQDVPVLPPKQEDNFGYY